MYMDTTGQDVGDMTSGKNGSVVYTNNDHVEWNLPTSKTEQQDTTLHRTKAATKILCHLILSAICGEGQLRTGKGFIL